MGSGHKSWVQWVRALILAGLILVSLSGCGQGLPDEVKKSAKALPKAVEAAQTDIEKTREQFASLKKSPEFAPVAPYALEENWDQMFDQANQALERARDMYKKELAPLIKQDTPEAAPQVLAQITRITQVIQEARDQSKGPVNRFARIQEAMANTRDIRERAQAAQERIFTRVDRLAAGPVAEARNKFPDAAGNIDARLAPFLKIQEDSTLRLQALTREYQAHTSHGTADYAAFIDNADLLMADFQTLEKSQPLFEQEVSQLYQSYTKILQDMRQDFFVTIKRESWNDNSDYYDPKFAAFQRQVSPAAYEALAETDLETIAEVVPGFGGVRFKTPMNDTWKALNINPLEHWPERNHNAATFWVEEAKALYYHKYLKEENGETTETDWIQVDPSFYQENLEFLGMAILSKPYGVFEQDRVVQATPPGMAYMGNPEYGEWKKNDQGESFWSWYGKYALFSHLFFFPPSYFHYGAWNGWRSNFQNKQPYFGKTQDGTQQYGTRGAHVKNSPKYQAGNFAKTGGFKSPSPSVRGGGAKLRGGGPTAKGK